MSDTSTSVIGAKRASINAMVPVTLAACSPMNPDEPNAGQAYLVFAEVQPHHVTYGMAVADLLSQKVIHTVPLDDEPMSIAVTPDAGFVYIAGSDHLLAIQTDSFDATPTPLTVPTGAIADAPGTTFPLKLLTGLALSADATQLVVAGQQQPPTVEEHGYLALVDTGVTSTAGAPSVLKAVTSSNATDFQQHHVVLNSDASRAIVNLQMQRIDVVDVASFSISKFKMFNPDAVLALAIGPDDNTLYVATGPLGGATGAVQVVDLDVDATVKTFPLPSAPHQLAVSADGGHLFVLVGAGGNAPTLLVLDATDGTQVDSLADAGPFALDPAGGRIHVYDSSAKVLNVYDVIS